MAAALLEPSDVPDRRWDVIVVGAGAAGLAAAERLTGGGLSVALLEGRSAIGGRIRTRRMRGCAVPIELGWHVHDWNSYPFSRGAYSFVRVGGTRAPALLARPINGTLFFAGEATSPDQSGTVPGAIESGRRAARQILEKR